MSEDLTQKLPAEDGALARILNAVQNLNSTVQNLSTKVESLDARLTSLENKVETRLYDTRPIWEQVVADIARLQTDVTQLKEGQQKQQEGQQAFHIEMRTEMRNLNRKMSVLNDSFLEVRSDYKDLDRRLYELEKGRT